MPMKYDPVAGILGSIELLLWVIILVRAPECLVYAVDHVRDGREGILVIKKLPCA